MIEIFVIFDLIFLSLIKVFTSVKILPFVVISFLGIIISSILDMLNYIIFRKENIEVQKKFTKRIDGLVSSFYRAMIYIITLPTKAYMELKAITKTIYRMKVTREHLLEWTTSEETERQNKKDLKSMYRLMTPNVVLGVLSVVASIARPSILDISIYNTVKGQAICWIFAFLLSSSWLLAPLIMWYISRPRQDKKQLEKLNKEEQEYTLKIAKNTWEYFLDFMKKEDNYLPPDNFQENRREKVVHRTSSTNIGLGFMTVISAYDLKFITLEKALSMLENMMEIVIKLDKWNGHLYNWYNTITLKPLTPRYISTVDSGNFVRIYVYAKRLLEREGVHTI